MSGVGRKRKFWVPATGISIAYIRVGLTELRGYKPLQSSHRHSAAKSIFIPPLPDSPSMLNTARAPDALRLVGVALSVDIALTRRDCAHTFHTNLVPSRWGQGCEWSCG